MKFLSDILAKAGLTVDGVVTLNNTATGQTPAANDNSTKLATTAWVRTFVQPYSLPIASASVLGGIKVGSGLSIDSGSGVLSVTGGGAASIKSTQTFIATAGQTVFTVTNGYTAGLIDVFLNGVYLSPNQTTATNGSTVVLGEAALAGDIIDVIVSSAIYQGSATTTDQLPEGVVNLYYTDARSRAAISLTVTGTSGASTYNSSTGVLNVPTYTLAGLGGVASTRTITINGVTYDLTANRSWSALPTGGVAGQLLAKIDGTDYNAQWIDEAPAASYTSQVKHQVKAGEAINKGQAVFVSSADGTNMIVSKASNATEGTSSKTMGLLESTVSTNGFTNVIAEGLLSGLDTTGANAAGDPVWLGTDGNLIYGLTNKPSAPAHLVFIGVVTRRNANNGEIFVKVQNGFELDELHNVSAQSPSNGNILQYVTSTGLWTAVGGTTTNIAEGTNLYYTDARARASNSFAAGSGAYNSTTGVITIPTNNNQITNGSNFITLASLSAGVGISYNNTTGVITNSAPDQTVALTASTGISVTGTYPNFTITNTSPSSGGTVTSVAALTIGTSGTDLSSTVATSTTTPVITLNVPTASATNRGALSSADWSTFNSKQGTITLTTTGTSGAATFSANTLNIPNYGSALSSYVPYTGATTNLNLGTYGLTTATITITGGAGTTGSLNFGQSDAFAIPANGYSSIDAVNTTFSFAVGTGTTTYKYFTFLTTSLTDNTLRNYTLPDASGTIALTSNIPSLTGYVNTSGSPTTNYLPKFTGASTIGNSIVYDDGTNVGIGTTASTTKLRSNGTVQITAAGSPTNGAGLEMGYGNFTAGRTTITSYNRDGAAFLGADYNALNYIWYTSGSQKMTLDTSGNLGLGVTPSAWNNIFIGIDFANKGGVNSYTNYLALSQNMYYGSGALDGWRYKATGYAAAINLESSSGNIVFRNTTTSGTANAALTWQDAMTLTAAGRLLIGTPYEATYLLDVNGTGRFTATSSTPALKVTLVANANATLLSSVDGSGYGWQFQQEEISTGDFRIFRTTANTSAQVLNLSRSTGAATFSSSVTAGGTITQTSSAATLLLNRTGGSTYGAGVQYQTSGTNNWIVGTGQTTTGTDYQIYNYAVGGALNISYGSNNIQINSTTDAGYKLDVNGTGRFVGTVTGTSFIHYVNSSYNATSSIYGISYNFGSGEVTDAVTYSISGGSASTTGNSFIWKTQTGGGTPTTAFTIAKTGAATFSSTVTTGDVLYVGSGGGGGGVWTWDGSNAYIYSPSGKNLWLTTDASLSKGLKLSTTGEATFSSSVTAVGLKTNGGGNVNLVPTAYGSNGFVSFRNTADNANRWNIYNYTGGGTTYGSLNFSDGSGTDRFVINEGGAATFSSSVTAASQIKSTNTSGTSFYTDSYTSNSVGDRMYGTYSGGLREDGSYNLNFDLYDRTATTWRTPITIRNNGNVGIGTTSPQSYTNYRILHIAGQATNGSGLLYMTNSDNSIVGMAFAEGNAQRVTFGSQTNHPVTFLTNDTERMRITNLGYLQLKGSSTATNAAAEIDVTDTTTDFYASLSGSVAKTMRFFYNGGSGEAMRITSGGVVSCLSRVLVNGATDDSTNALQVNGSIVATSTIAAVVPSNVDMFVFNNTGATYTKSCVVASMTATGGTGSYFFYGQQSTSTVALKIFSNGNIQNTNNSYGAISDARLKENIIDATPKLADLMKVKVRNYNLKGESNKQLGVISQELEEIFPNMIEESTNLGENVKIKGVKYSVFVPMLIKAVQEQQEQINELKQLLNK